MPVFLQVKDLFSHSGGQQRIPDAFPVRYKSQHPDGFSSSLRVATMNCCVVEGCYPADIRYRTRIVSVSWRLIVQSRLDRGAEDAFEEEFELDDYRVEKGCEMARTVICRVGGRTWTASLLQCNATSR